MSLDELRGMKEITRTGTNTWDNPEFRAAIEAPGRRKVVIAAGGSSYPRRHTRQCVPQAATAWTGVRPRDFFTRSATRSATTLWLRAAPLGAGRTSPA